METKKKKAEYEEVKLELIPLSSADVITTSDTSLDPDGNYDDKAWT